MNFLFQAKIQKVVFVFADVCRGHKPPQWEVRWGATEIFGIITPFSTTFRSCSGSTFQSLPSSIHWSVWFFACFREQPLFLRSVVLNSRDMTNKFLVLDFAENRSWFGLTDTLYLLVFKKKSYRCFIIFTANSSKSVSYHLSTNSKPNRINFQFFMSF